ncbi:uncharacterized protein LOC132552842 [Ylistrum balloti]|uniref:uncharacterized protein LOC132552842 n=1 Tax=Ylistrum balloti TaxID=509963 RepID=UPI0029059BE2|nr:uncharacterized protein LOC132552842 [Ylistrum balloti]
MISTQLMHPTPWHPAYNIGEPSWFKSGVEIRFGMMPRQTYVSCSHIHAYDKQQVVLQNTRCYHLAQESLSWNDAAVRCRTNNGALASIPDTEVNSVLLELSTNLDYNNLANVSFYWIGGRVLSRGKGVTWLQDPGTKFVAFNDGEPQGFNEFGCFLLDPGTGGWATDICQAELELVGYICEYPSKEKGDKICCKTFKESLTVISYCATENMADAYDCRC